MTKVLPNDMVNILYIIATFAFILNLSCPSELTNTNAIVLILEYLGVLFVSNYIIRKNLKAGKKSKERYLAFFLIGLTVSLLFLHFVWTPNLPENSKDWGFDPQRYYYYSSMFVKGTPMFDGLNYFGIVFFYIGLFYVFGINPLVPLFINSLFVLYSVVIISNHFFAIGGKAKYFALLLLIPEVVYFNCIPSREIICLTMATIAIVKSYEAIELGNKKSYISVFLSILLMIIIRPPMGGGVIIAISLFIALRGHFKMKYLLIIAVLAIIVVQGLSVSSSLDTHQTDTGSSLTEAVSDRISGDNEEDATASYSSNSLARLLMPHNPVEFIVFGIIRSFAYVIIPPGLLLNPVEYLNFSKPGTEGFASVTVILMMIYLPAVYRNIRRKIKGDNSFKIIALALITLFFLVGVFNTNIIHQRYRVVYDLFYFSIVACHLSISKKT